MIKRKSRVILLLILIVSLNSCYNKSDKNINLEMARAGLAEVQQQEAPADFLLEPLIEAEKQAQSNQKGIWAQGEGYMSPGEWRQTERARSACAILLYGIYGKTKR